MGHYLTSVLIFHHMRPHVEIKQILGLNGRQDVPIADTTIVEYLVDLYIIHTVKLTSSLFCDEYSTQLSKTT